jgi:hypothetical protein
MHPPKPTVFLAVSDDIESHGIHVMEVQSTNRVAAGTEVLQGNGRPAAPPFSHTFQAELAAHTRGKAAPGTPMQSEASASSTRQGETMYLGEISPGKPTVSHLLTAHPDFRRECWRIIHAAVNRHKAFAQIQVGARVYVNQQTNELSWQTNHEHTARTVSHRRIDLAQQTQQTNPVGQVEKSSYAPADGGTESGKLLLGTLAPETPTVADLLLAHPDFRRDTWRIIHAELNQDKPYTTIPEGTQVFIDRQTLELSWPDHNGSPGFVAVAQAPEELAAVPTSLAQAVEPFLGRSYDEMDCYDLIVRGLQEMGVRYQGRGGLRDTLVQMALDKGLPMNAYLTGEGLVEATGSKLYTTSLTNLRNWPGKAQKVIQQMEPLLEKGLVLSFSTPTRGHTGVVSKRDGLWTYINSGRIDHHVGPRGTRRGVGEEVLSEEIKNWFKLAVKRRESLQITLGKVHEEKFRAALQPNRVRRTM